VGKEEKVKIKEWAAGLQYLILGCLVWERWMRWINWEEFLENNEKSAK